MAAVDPEEPMSNGNNFQLTQRDDDYRNKILAVRGEFSTGLLLFDCSH